MTKHRFLWFLAGVTLASSGAFAYPDKPIQYIIPFPAGGESDIAARVQAQVAKEKFGQQMIVINRAGAGGALVWSQLNTYPADGYTIAGINLPHIVLQPLEGNVQYKTEDLTPVYYFHYTANAVVVPQTSPYKNLQDLINAAKANPGKVTLAGSATFSANHLAHERLNALAGIKTTYVPFKGTGDLVSSVVGGHVDGAMSYIPFAIQQKGKLRALAVSAERRHPALPDVPTFKELGYNWVDGAYRGVAVPKSTPAAVQKQVSDMMDAINKEPVTRKKMQDDGFEVVDIPLDRIPAFQAERTKEYLQDAKMMGVGK